MLGRLDDQGRRQGDDIARRSHQQALVETGVEQLHRARARRAVGTGAGNAPGRRRPPPRRTDRQARRRRTQRPGGAAGRARGQAGSGRRDAAHVRALTYPAARNPPTRNRPESAVASNRTSLSTATDASPIDTCTRAVPRSTRRVRSRATAQARRSTLARACPATKPECGIPRRTPRAVTAAVIAARVQPSAAMPTGTAHGRFVRRPSCSRVATAQVAATRPSASGSATPKSPDQPR